MPYTHYARLGYAVAAIGRTLPRWLAPLATAVSRVVPSAWMVPFAFGDIKMFIARRPNAD